jgi:hypothetical protein
VILITIFIVLKHGLIRRRTSITGILTRRELMEMYDTGREETEGGLGDGRPRELN